MDVFRYKRREEASENAGRQVSLLMKETRKKPVLVLLSGGSSFEVVGNIDPRNLGANVAISMLDERYSRDPSVNNFAQFANHELYGEGKKRKVCYIDTRVQARIINEEEMPETSKEFIARITDSFQKWKESNPGGRVIITQGIGEDGHTAGIMPYPLQRDRFQMLFDDKTKWVVGYTKRGTHPMRVTVTFPFLRNVVDYSVVYVVGTSKKAVFARVLLEKTKIWEIPARIIHQMKNVSLFTDIS